MLLGAAAALGLAYYRLFGGPLEDTSWEIKLKADSFFAFSHRDTLTFGGGKLRATGYQGDGFKAGVYSAQRVGGDVDALWNASLTDAERGTMTWHGLVRGDTIEGVAILVRKDGKQKRFTFKGHRA